MFIGSKSTSTVIEIFMTGLKSVIREAGLPSSLLVETDGCKMTAKGADLTKRIDKLMIVFDVKEDVTTELVEQALAATKIGGRIKVEDKVCTLTMPPFEPRQAHHLTPVDAIVEQNAIHSMRSRTWQLTVDGYVKSNFNVNMLVEKMAELKASDIHLRAGNRPYVRIDNDLYPLENMGIISAQDMREFMLTLGGTSQLEFLEMEKESSFQYHAAGLGYLRCSGYIKTNAMAIAIRLIPEEPIPISKLNLPPVIYDICKAKRGLFLVCGITGSGKSTTLAAMVDHINESHKAHIITAEDPIEFVYRDKQSIISQRMVGRDTFSFANALRGALREDPDVILVGEMRDVETIRAGLSAAETGHLVFSTLHTTTAVDTVNRIISYFPQSERDLIRQELAYTLQGVVCQRLLKRIGGGRIPCVEILLGGRPIVRDAIIDGDLDKLHGIMENDTVMKSFDQYAVYLYQQGLVTKEEAISACSDEEGFERVITGIRSSTGKLLK